jgi:hypothetical protein
MSELPRPGSAVGELHPLRAPPNKTMLEEPNHNYELIPAKKNPVRPDLPLISPSYHLSSAIACRQQLDFDHVGHQSQHLQHRLSHSFTQRQGARHSHRTTNCLLPALQTTFPRQYSYGLVLFHLGGQEERCPASTNDEGV